MTKLTDSQLMVLSSASAREDHAAVPPPQMRKAAALRVGASLVARKLLREVRARLAIPVWRQDDEGREIALVLTKAGLAAINADPAEEGGKKPPVKVASAHKRKQTEQLVMRVGATKPDRAELDAPATAKRRKGPGPRAAGTKQAQVIAMMSGTGGASLDTLIAATGWLPHTTRAMLTGLRKKGFALERVREDGVTTYRITGHPAAAGA